MDDTPHPLSPDNAETPHLLSSMDDIVTRLRRWPCDDIDNIYDIKDDAIAEIERLRKEVDIKGYRLDDALDEIALLKEERDRWQAEAAGISQDISNAEDEIERLRDELADWQRTVRALEEENKRLQRENTRAHLDLLVAHSEILGLYDHQADGAVSDQRRSSIFSNEELITLSEVVDALRKRSTSWTDGCCDDSYLDTVAANALDCVVKRFE